MRFLRRRSADEVDAAADGTAESGESYPGSETGSGRTAGKGRPTPKRRDAEGRRRGPAPPPPRTQRESMKLAKQNRASREERRKASAERRGKMLAGDEKSLPARDRGPVKAYIRDMVDCRRHLMGLFMPLAGFIFLSLLLPSFPRVQNLLTLFSMTMILAMALEGVLLGRQVTKRARERFPKEEVGTLSTSFYAFTRASQLRRLRVPKPRVSYGAKA
ncbi:MAG: DUF3043 domain-containing protein [Actinomycetota bacterium]|nr:DUF3043 domain-containing protein [Actinomycetota bacterium]